MQNTKKPAVFMIVSIIAVVLVGTAFAQKPILEKKLPVSGLSETVFEVKEWGRYAITVEGSEGTALQLIDKKVGARQEDGLPGERNGRIDDFFDFGEYRIIARSHEKGTVSPQLKIYPYEELNRNAPQYLAPVRDYEESLKDFEQLSYWIHLEKDSTILFEVLGRNVADVQLWKDGQWRVDAKRASITSYPLETTPLKGYRIIQKLKAGYYQLTIYGGPVADWSEHNDKHPVYFRLGLPRFPATGTGTYTVSKTGYNQFLVPSSTHFAVLTAPDKEKTIAVSTMQYNKGDPDFKTGVNTDSIHTKSREPKCMVRTSRSSHYGYHIIRVSGMPGRQFTIQTFEGIQSSLRVDTTAYYWISTQHTGYPQDQLGVTGGIVHVDDRNIKIVKTSVDTVSSGRFIKRRFNLLDDISLVFWVEDNGKYEFIPDSAGMKMSVYRLLMNSSHKLIKESTRKTTITLEKGYYILELDPAKKGVAQLEIRSSSLMGKARKMTGLQSRNVGPEPNLQFPSVKLDEDHGYRFFLNSLSPEIAGLIFRKLPLDLSEPLPVYLRPNKSVSVKVNVREESDLYFTDDRGRHFSFEINGKKRKSPARVKKGSYELTFSSDSLVCLFAKTVPLSHLPSAKPKPFPTGKWSPLQIFPELQAGEPTFIDMDRNDFEVYEFNIKEPGIYRFETTGRLKTALTLRDRFIVRTHHQEANGIGRNALIQTYLLPGRYQTMVRTRNQSTGRLGLSLEKNEMINGGKLTVEREKRHVVPLGVGIEYDVEISHNGTYHLVSQGQGGYFEGRFEDAEGWPLVKPGEKTDIKVALDKGAYRLISLPQKRETTRIARLAKTEKQQQYEGKGPHILSLNETARSVWMEDSTENGRQPAKFVIDIPAPVRCRLSCTKGFDAKLYNKGTAVLAWEGVMDTLLPMGVYTLEVVSRKPQNYAEFQVSASTSMLVTGLSYPLPLSVNKKQFTVSVGKKTVVELFSQGMRDVAATLRLKDSDSVVAQNDDGTNDWNFKISQVLEPALYTLTVDNRGSSHGRCEIRMSSLPDTIHEKWPLEEIRSIDLEGKIHSIPVVLNEAADVINLEVYGGSRVGTIIERKEKADKYVPVGEKEGDTVSLSVKIEPKKSYRLRVWSADHLNEKVNISVNTSRFQNVSLDDLLKGKKVKATTKGLFSNAYLSIDLDKDSLGHFTAETNNNFSTVRTVSGVGQSFKRDHRDYISALSKTVYAELQFLKSGSHLVKLTPVRVDSSLYIPVTSLPRAFDCKPSGKVISVFSAEMKNGTPMCGTYTKTEGDFHPAGVPVRAGASRNRRQAVGVALPGDSYRFLVWNADIKSAQRENPVSISQEEFKSPQSSRLDLGDTEWELSAPGVKIFTLKRSSPALIQVTVPRGGIVVWKRKDGSRVTHSTDEKFASYTFREKEGKLYCISTEAPSYFHVRCIALNENESFDLQTLKPDSHPVEFSFNRSAIKRIPIEGRLSDLSQYKLFLHGPVSRVNWWTGNGMYLRDIGTSFPLEELPSFSSHTKAGFLEIEHDAGLVVANLHNENSANMCWGSDLKVQKTRKIGYPQVLTLQNGTNWFSLSVDKPTHVRLSTESNCLGVLLKEGKPLQTYIGTEGFSADVPLQKGTYDFGIRGIGEVPLENSSVTFSYKDIDELRETEPPLVRLTSGGSRLLQFTLSEDRKIGVGLDTDKEVWQAKTYSEKFELVGEGQQQFLSLKKGKYYLWLSIPHYQKSAECIVRLVGQDVPSEQPPESVIRKYIHR
ncbi:MAG: hypothetical protein ACLFVQ_08625 [Chitinispirillaceae bacterium]